MAMETVQVYVPEGFEIADMKVQYKRVKRAVKVSVKQKTCKCECE